MGEGHASDQSTGGTTSKASATENQSQALERSSVSQGEERGNQTGPKLEAQEETQTRQSSFSKRSVFAGNGWERRWWSAYRRNGLLPTAKWEKEEEKESDGPARTEEAGNAARSSAETRPESV